MYSSSPAQFVDLMGKNTVIKVENLSKQYRLGEVGTGTISHDLNRWWHRIRGKEDPYLRIGESNDRSKKGNSEYVWALQDINFEVQQGEVLGIIGKNGAGKSTLLKILSKVTAPTTGAIKAKGRIAALLEVGTGFHPELTGRENIYLNGTILGMTKREVSAKLDEIVDFSGVERYLDTPVKRYSSGMMVRLGFAVAAHLEPEILIVDEVLAVGDLDFQKKCINKMRDISRGGGRSILFVSHNMQAISSLCNRIVIIKNGITDFDGPVNRGIEHYLQQTDNNSTAEQIHEILQVLPRDEFFELKDLKIEQEDATGYEFVNSKPIQLQCNYQVHREVSGLRVGFDLIEKSSDTILFRTFHDDAAQYPEALLPGYYNSRVCIPKNFLKQGTYLFQVLAGIHNVRWIIYDEIRVEVNLTNIDGLNRVYADERPGLLMPDLQWENLPR